MIEHRYRPSVGETVGTALGSPHAAKEIAQYARKYCLDKEFLTAVDQSKKGTRREYGAPFTEERIDYILKTGANWSGPIGDFRLVVDKGDAGQSRQLLRRRRQENLPDAIRDAQEGFPPRGKSLGADPEEDGRSALGPAALGRHLLQPEDAVVRPKLVPKNLPSRPRRSRSMACCSPARVR